MQNEQPTWYMNDAVIAVKIRTSDPRRLREMQQWVDDSATGHREQRSPWVLFTCFTEGESFAVTFHADALGIVDRAAPPIKKAPQPLTKDQVRFAFFDEWLNALCIASFLRPTMTIEQCLRRARFLWDHEVPVSYETYNSDPEYERIYLDWCRDEGIRRNKVQRSDGRWLGT